MVEKKQEGDEMNGRKATVREQAEEALRDGNAYLLKCALERLLEGSVEFKPTLRDGSPNQVNVIAAYIIAEIPGEPSRSEGAGDTAVRLLKKYRAALQSAKSELGVPGSNHPMPTVNAHRILEEALRTEW